MPYHCAPRLDVLRAVVARMPPAFARLRAAGYRVGINHLSTLGHHEENLELAADPSLQRQVGLDGVSSRGVLCPADPAVRAYVRETYELFAATWPDILWIDDDIRYATHLPTGGCCLCNRCLADFSREMNETFTRASLVAAFDDPDEERRVRLRTRFMERNARVIRELFVLIEATVHAVSPKTELGFMTGDRFWEGYAFEAWAEALRGDSKLPVRWRPGGGFYGDERPAGLVEKVHDVGRQCSRLPACVSVVQAEVENFPYQALRKARQINALEMTGYLFAGCTGNALNILGGDDPAQLDEHEPLLDHLHRHVPFWNEVKSLLRGTELAGLWPAWDGLQIAAGSDVTSFAESAPAAATPVAAGLDFSGAARFATLFADVQSAMAGPYSLAGLGVPVCYAPGAACVAAFSGLMPRALGVERMKAWLAKGVLLDAPAARTLAEMGLGAYTGVEVGRGYALDTVEHFAKHPLNGASSGAFRDCRQSFNKELAHELIPRDAGVETAAYMTDYQGRERGPSVALFENALGGRVGVLSYFPWSFHQGLARREQLLSLCDWLARDALPLRIQTLARIYPWVRHTAKGDLVIGLLNLSADTYEKVLLKVRCDRSVFRRLRMDGRTEALHGVRSDGGLDIVLDRVLPFTFEVIHTERS